MGAAYARPFPTTRSPWRSATEHEARGPTLTSITFSGDDYLDLYATNNVTITVTRGSDQETYTIELSRP